MVTIMVLAHALNHVADATAQVACNQGTLDCETGIPQVTANSAHLRAILQIIFGILAVIAVIIIIVWGGLRLMTESNNPQEIAKARNAIIYAVAGLVIAVSGEIIVSFVLRRV